MQAPAPTAWPWHTPPPAPATSPRTCHLPYPRPASLRRRHAHTLGDVRGKVQRPLVRRNTVLALLLLLLPLVRRLARAESVGARRARPRPGELPALQLGRQVGVGVAVLEGGGAAGAVVVRAGGLGGGSLRGDALQ